MSLLSGLAAALVAACLLPLDAAAADQRAALQADRQWMTALEQKDVPAVQALLDAEFQWTNTEGLTLDRSATIANAPALAAALRGDTGVQTYDYGHVAVITSVRQGTRLMRVWTLRPEGWRAFAVIATEQATGTQPFAASGGEESGDCDNPCRTMPFTPRTGTEKSIAGIFQQLKMDEWKPNPANWAPYVLDDVYYVTATARLSKADRVTRLAQLKQTGAPSVPGDPVVSMRIADFGDAAVMTATHTPYRGGRPYYSVRVWAFRDGRWQLANTQQTTIAAVQNAVQNAQTPPVPPMVVEKIRDDLFVIRGEGGNITVYVTDEGLVLVDDKFERNYDEFRAKLASISDKPVKYVINTHAHADHTGGNAKLLPSAHIIAHANARAAMVKGKQPGLPQETYTDEMRITLGGKEVVASHFGPCHTDGDTFVYFPAAKVVSAGDCFNTGNGQGLNLTGSPTFSFYIDYTTGGSLLGRAKVAEAVLKLDFDTVVPGHGPLTNRAGFVRWRSDVDAIINRIRTLVREGKSKDDIAVAMVSEFGWEAGGRTIVASLDAMMAELAAPARTGARNDQEVDPLEGRFGAALAKRDTAALEQLLDPEFSWVTTAGVLRARSSILAMPPELRIPENGKGPATRAARALGSRIVVVQYHHSGNFHAMHVWVKRASEWRLLHINEVEEGPRVVYAGTTLGGAECINPCTVVPFVPATPNERAVMESWQAQQSSPELWAQHIPDDNVARTSNGTYTKADRMAVQQEQTKAGTKAAAGPLTYARIWEFGDSALMLALQPRAVGKPFWGSRVFELRNGVWMMAESYQTTIQDF